MVAANSNTDLRQKGYLLQYFAQRKVGLAQFWPNIVLLKCIPERRKEPWRLDQTTNINRGDLKESALLSYTPVVKVKV